MKILRVIGSMDPSVGGPCQGIRNTIPELERLGIHNEVLALNDPRASFLDKDKFTIHAIGSATGPWCYSPHLIPWLLNNLERFDAVIVHGLWLYHSYAVSKALGVYKKHQLTNNSKGKCPKLYIMPHGMLDPYFQQAAGRKLKAFRNWVYWKLIEHRVVNEATGLLFTCEEELRLARLPFRPYHPKQEFNIGYGIMEPPSDSSHLRDAFWEKCREIHGCPYILFLGRIHQKKGVDLLLKAYRKLATKMLKANAGTAAVGIAISEADQHEFSSSLLPKLVIAGPGLETAYGRSLQQLVSSSQVLQSSVFFPGMLSGDAKWGAFYGCEAFVLPSHQENFGIAVAEALACSKPVLISDKVNIWREIDAAGAGKVAEDDQKGVQELLEYFVKLSVEERQLIGQNGRALYQTRFAASSMAKKLKTVVV